MHERAQEDIEGALQKVAGVLHVVTDAPAERVILVCDGLPRPGLEAAARSALAESGGEGPLPELVFSYVAKPDTQRRVRFGGLTLDRPHPNFSAATATLEWQGEEFVGTAQGEGGAPLELRICAQATVEALHGILRDEVTFQLVGIKAIRIFDHDLVAVLLHSPQALDRRLIGSSLVVEDQLHRSAGLAVLNATNRLLGNYLATE